MIRLAITMAILISLTLYVNFVVAQSLHGVTDALSGGGGITPPTCSGAIDTSQGCTLPMLGVL